MHCSLRAFEHTLLVALVITAARSSAQPICDVILRPAFHYTVDGMSVILADSSRSIGIEADALWTFGDGSMASSSPDHEFTQPGSYTVCLTLTALEGPACSSSYCREVVVPGAPCPPSQEPYFEYEQSGTNALSFQFAVGTSVSGNWSWDFGDGVIGADAFPIHTWALPGPHFVTLTDQAGDCVATYGRWVEVDGNGTTCGPGLFVDFSPVPMMNEVVFEPSIITSGHTAMLGIWSFGDGQVDTAFATQHEYQVEGSYQTCFLVGAIDETGEDTCFSLVCHTFGTTSLVGIEDDPALDLTVWPNPVSGTLHFRIPYPGPVLIRLVDLSGRALLTERRIMGSMSSLTMDGVAPGQYLLEVDQGVGRSVTRILVHRSP